MIRIVYFLLIIVLISCKTSTIAQEKVNEPKSKVEKPKFSDVASDKIGPNMVRLSGLVKTLSRDTDICDKNYKLTIELEIQSEVISGFGIVNVISIGEEVVFGLSNLLTQDIEAINQEINIGNTISILANESLCTDMSITVYEITNILE